jgi:3-(3-hydroxy-phenyl)propionate hydroxylase
MEHFRHGRVLFAGDAAHGVSPFGARGANSGVQDVDNLCWKLAMVMQASAPQRLLDSYCAEREFAADENILQSSRSTDFITPKSTASRSFRDAVLELSREHPFARRLVNSGRLSLPSILRDSPLNTPDTEGFAGLMGPGAPAADAPVRLAGRVDWLLAQLGGEFTLLVFGEPEAAAALPAEFAVSDGAAIALRVVCIVAPGSVCAAGPRAVALEDVEGLAAQRYDGRPGTAYLLRPDQHVCARWRRLDADAVRAALARATCND